MPVRGMLTTGSGGAYELQAGWNTALSTSRYVFIPMEVPEEMLLLFRDDTAIISQSRVRSLHSVSRDAHS